MCPQVPSGTSFGKSCPLRDALEDFASAALLKSLQAHHAMRLNDPVKHMLKRGAAKYLALAFALIFLVFQSSTLVHSHAGDLNKHLDCTFCLKIGAGDDVLPAIAILPPVAMVRHNTLLSPDSVVVAAPTTPRSRSPPLIALI
jgi:hypothetical protein